MYGAVLPSTALSVTVCSQSAPCNLTFGPRKDVFKNLPGGQRLLRPELHESSFVRGTQPGWSGPRPSVRSLLRSTWLLRVAPFLLVRAYNSFTMKCDADICKGLFTDVVPSGGTTIFQEIGERVKRGWRA